MSRFVWRQGAPEAAAAAAAAACRRARAWRRRPQAPTGERRDGYNETDTAYDEEPADLPSD